MVLGALRILALSFAVPQGCTTMDRYIHNRALDFIDCFKADAGYGYGIGAHVRLTEFSSLGVGA